MFAHSDANDELTTDQYDADGNTIGSGLNTGTSGYVYDFENRLVQQAGIAIVYDGDGNRVSKTVANGTTQYLVDDLNPTGYAQVMDEMQSSAVTRAYTWGLDLISEHQTLNATLTTSYYVFDGHGSVRALTNSAGAVTDTYDYDAFGILTRSTGTTPNNYLFAGEQFDPDLNLYYNRARYLNTSTGRFWSTDTFEGDPQAPASLHKYLYSQDDPVGLLDRSGRDAFVDVTTALGVIGTILSQSLPLFQNIAYQLYFNLYRVPQLIDAVSNVLLFAQGAVAVGSAATSVIEQMATNLQNSTKTLPPGGGPMGNDVEDIAGRNLLRNAQSYDYFDPEGQVAGQIQGTRATSTPKALMAVIQKGVGKLTDAPDVVDTRFESGQRVQIVKSDLKVRFLVQAIPDEPVSWDFKAFMQQVEQLEESTGVVIKIVPTPGLD